MLKACTSCRLGPRVGVSLTRYAFKLPRSRTILKELGIMANHCPNNIGPAPHGAFDVSIIKFVCRCNIALAQISRLTRRAALGAASSFFFRADWREFDMTFLPGFLAGLSLRAAYQLKQTKRTAAKMDIVARSKFFRLCQETVRTHRVENQLALDLFLSRKDKWDRFVVGVNQ